MQSTEELTGKTSRALITGGAGFIGSHLSELLLQRGYEVQIIDDLSTGRVDNVEHLKANPRFSYVIGSIFDRPLVAELVDRSDMIFHLAAAVGVKLIVEQPVSTIETNIKSTELILELAAKKQKPTLIASTSEVYGKLEKEKFNEEDELVLGPTSKARWCYAASKIIDEFLAKAYFKEHGLPVVVVRLFNTIGPRQTGQYGMVVPTFVRQALRGETITVYGDGTQQRAFSWVGDVVGAMLSLIKNMEAYGEVFNIGHTQVVSIHELAAMAKELSGSSSEIGLIPYSEAYEQGFEDMARRCPDISKIQRLIGFSPSLDLSEMLRRVIQYEQTQLD